MRVFIAIEIGDDARVALERVLRRVGRIAPGARVVAPASLHLTLAFLGELEDSEVETAIGATREVGAMSAPMWLSLGRLGSFGSAEAPRVVWAGVGGQVSRLARFQRRLAGALASQGFVLDDKPFAPHLTLARIKAPLDEIAARNLRGMLEGPALRAENWLTRDVLVMRSELARSGARYTPLAVIPLGAEGQSEAQDEE